MNLPLLTSRLILRPFEPRDAAAFAQYRSDPEVARYQSWNTPYSLEQARRFIEALAVTQPGTPGEWFQVAIQRKDDGALLGDCAFTILAENLRQAEIGFTLARAYQGQGYGTEAVRRLLDYLLGELGLHRVRANCDPQNTSSARLLQRLGFRHEGRWVESLWFKGRWASEDWYALLRREWETGQVSGH